MIDTHCHLQFNAYRDDHEAVIKRCQEKGVILNVVGSQRDTSRRAIEYAEKYPDMYATVGLHPIHLFKSHVDEQEINFETRGEEFDYEYYKMIINAEAFARSNNLRFFLVSNQIDCILLFLCYFLKYFS